MVNTIGSGHTIKSPRKFSLSLLDEITLQEELTPNGRYYSNEMGVTVPSVTTVLKRIPKPQIIAWQKRLGKVNAANALAFAGKQGSSLHALCEAYIQDGQVSLSPNDPYTNTLFLQIKKPLDKSLGNVLGIEFPLFSEKLKTAGRTDIIAEWNGELAIIDYKTSKKEKPEKYLDGYYMQSTCYALMANDQHNLKIEKFVLLIGCSEGIGAQVVERKVSDFADKTIKFFSDIEARKDASNP